jgi:tetratricopeptide (TPR) repeat protein
MYAWSRGNLAEAIEHFERALAAAEPGEATYARLLTECLIRAGRLDEAQAMIERFETRDREHGRSRDYWQVENLGMLAFGQGRLERAERLLEEAVQGFGRIGSKTGQMEAMTYLAWITIDLGKEQRTELLAERALAMAREDSDVMIEANCLWLLARIELRRGDLRNTRVLLEQCVGVARRRDERISLVLALYVWADLAHCAGDAQLAPRLFAAADRHLRSIPHIMPPSIGAGYEVVLADLRRTLGEPAFNAAWDAGLTLPLNDAIDMAAQLNPPDR